jgi:phage shock protein PspC (stress-responsive transcriptional regulator)
MAEKKLYRSRKQQMIGGVAGGVAEYYGYDVTLVRLAFVLLLIVFNGAALAAYIIAWFIIPEAPLVGATKEESVEKKTETVAQDVKDAKEPKENKVAKEAENERYVGGFILIAIGLAFLIQKFIDVNVFAEFWPLILIVIGLTIIFRRK